MTRESDFARDVFVSGGTRRIRRKSELYAMKRFLEPAYVLLALAGRLGGSAADRDTHGSGLIVLNRKTASS